MEAGSTDGGSYGDITYIPFITGLLMLGVLFALLGFWRVGASLATQLGADAGAVSPGQGAATTDEFLSLWSGSGPWASSFVTTPQNRSVRANVNARFSFDYMGFGTWTFGVDGQTASRSERFYPGAPVCNSGTCGE